MVAATLQLSRCEKMLYLVIREMPVNTTVGYQYNTR